MEGGRILKRTQFGEALLAMTLLVPSLHAGDLTKIDRTIPKEPGYQTKPVYCLLVFGPEAKERVWLVIDGDVLYVDRNGDGDLTEKDKKVPAIRIKDYRLFRAGIVKPGEREYFELTVSRDRLSEGAAPLQPEHYRQLLRKDPAASGYGVGVGVDNPMEGKKKSDERSIIGQSASCDSHGFLQFGDSPQEAPIVHFGGPWSIDLHHRPNIMAGNAFDLQAGVGTPGLGAGTFAFIVTTPIPPAAHPRVDFEFPAKAPGDKSVRMQCELLQRC
jgi:hypothetical protein